MKVFTLISVEILSLICLCYGGKLRRSSEYFERPDQIPLRNLTRINVLKNLVSPAPFQNDSNLLIQDISTLDATGRIYVGKFPEFTSPAWVTLFDFFMNFECKNSSDYAAATKYDSQDYYIHQPSSLIYQGKKVQIRGLKIVWPKVIDLDFCSDLEAATKDIYIHLLQGKQIYISYENKSKEGGLILGFFFRKYLANLFESFKEVEEFIYGRTDVDYTSLKKGYSYVDCCPKYFPVLRKQ